MTMDSFERLLESYDYNFPSAAVALEPASPRDSAQLLVFDPPSGRVIFDTYRHLTRHLPPNSCLVFNETKVLPARIEIVKQSGGRARVLFLRRAGQNSFFALSDRKLPVGETVRVGDTELRVGIGANGEYRLSVLVGMTVIELLTRFGQMPLPPYLKKTSLKEREVRRKYQTVFARRSGSVAAPTASLHFTPRLLKSLRQAGHQIVFVTLHVNLGTFMPLQVEQVKIGELHEESYEISTAAAKIIEQAKKEGRSLIAVGTTVARTLESATGRRSGLAGSGTTRLFIRPGYRFKLVDGLITNFHVPKSSLLMLVAALVGRQTILRLYQHAIGAGLRLFSFGDGMLIRPAVKHHELGVRPSATGPKSSKSGKITKRAVIDK
ncbi:tRNA preQ1(34) S-adenosylmethionine ribosyltransferase-isomerase QueA [Candidatus Uhrbacteria bacterium RIFOXYC2_FULL_47_19]|uniref:S-adenosylmethionine:tRNA ribosyltransferase-isomerase n=1 Tax=Candidatus Uhrbacteria bacterium RIFOXYC2_FULL_47_19 TaxID=1802424 RepID=A0A1F7WCQ8_9BACT|nr:MAG: tRNA preQ1(34) S-adenosylmethionine ribosyltransferase-isomerase QueA [Candidatus Uhrbacteria bacterium RIFOXYC2_FULL_47_19]HCC21890.1 tRNA preQ1(34) S-adenosylmethionine ribosyltransferase-isomerase QueA [Candidatus Uhrbacteria bacterium]